MLAPADSSYSMVTKANHSGSIVDPGSCQRSNVWGPGPTVVWGILIISLQIITQLAVILYIAVTKGRLSFRHISLPVLKSFVHNGFVVAWATLASSLVCALAVIAIVKLKRDANLRMYLG